MPNFFIQSRKTTINRNSIVHVFPPLTGQLHEITVKFDWFTGLSALFVIGQWCWFYNTRLKTALTNVKRKLFIIISII